MEWLSISTGTFLAIEECVKTVFNYCKLQKYAGSMCNGKNPMRLSKLTYCCYPSQSYLTIIRRRRSEYWWIFPETKSRRIFTNIHKPEANNCFSIITQVIIEIPKQRKEFIPRNSQINWTWTWTWTSMCHAMPFWTRALKKKHFFDVHTGLKQIKM